MRGGSSGSARARPAAHRGRQAARRQGRSGDEARALHAATASHEDTRHGRRRRQRARAAAAQRRRDSARARKGQAAGEPRACAWAARDAAPPPVGALAGDADVDGFGAAGGFGLSFSVMSEAAAAPPRSPPPPVEDAPSATGMTPVTCSTKTAPSTSPTPPGNRPPRGVKAAARAAAAAAIRITQGLSTRSRDVFHSYGRGTSQGDTR